MGNCAQQGFQDGLLFLLVLICPRRLVIALFLFCFTHTPKHTATFVRKTLPLCLSCFFQLLSYFQLFTVRKLTILHRCSPNEKRQVKNFTNIWDYGKM
jgi:hypothetical protein